DQQIGGRRLPRSRCEPQKRLNHVDASLATQELGGEKKNGDSGFQLQLSAQLFTVWNGLRSQRPERIIIDGIGHREYRNAASEGSAPVLGIFPADGENPAYHPTEKCKKQTLGRKPRMAARAVVQC